MDWRTITILFKATAHVTRLIDCICSAGIVTFKLISFSSCSCDFVHTVFLKQYNNIMLTILFDYGN